MNSRSFRPGLFSSDSALDVLYRETWSTLDPHSWIVAHSSSAFFFAFGRAPNPKMEPLFRSGKAMVPEPRSRPGQLQKLHGLTKMTRACSPTMIFLASLSVSLSIRISRCPDRSLDVSSENSSPVLAGKDLDANLNYFTCDSGTSDDLNYLGLEKSHYSGKAGMAHMPRYSTP